MFLEGRAEQDLSVCLQSPQGKSGPCDPMSGDREGGAGSQSKTSLLMMFLAPTDGGFCRVLYILNGQITEPWEGGSFLHFTEKDAQNGYVT